MYPVNIILWWAATTPLVAYRQMLNFTLIRNSDVLQIERIFMNHLKQSMIGWDRDYPWERTNGFLQACLMNDREAERFTMANRLFYTKTLCEARLNNEHGTELIALKFEKLKLEDEYKDKDINAYVNECKCDTYKLYPNGTLTEDVLVHSEFTLIKVTGKNAYYHLQPVDEKYFKFVSYYELPQEYVDLFMA